jgi:hypothetical protein
MEYDEQTAVVWGWPVWGPPAVDAPASSLPNSTHRLYRIRKRVALARRRIAILRRQAFTGDYDTDEYDAAILELRQAQVEARNLLAELRISAMQEPSITTRRLQFVRWLVETGRLSDQK